MNCGMRPTIRSAQVSYAESSAIVAALLEGDTDAGAAFRVSAQHVTSALTPAEVRRAIVRARHDRRISREQERDAVTTLGALMESFQILTLSAEILDRVGRPFAAEPVRALDAIHLATIEAIADYPRLTTVVTRDRRVRANALAMGCQVA
jgi:predicted nucleic acid-binding protein